MGSGLMLAVVVMAQLSRGGPDVPRVDGGHVLVKTAGSSWLPQALDELSRRSGDVLLFCESPEPVALKTQGPQLAVPDGRAGVEALLRATGYTADALGDHALMVRRSDGNPCDYRIRVFAAAVGREAASAGRDVEMELLRTSHIRTLLPLDSNREVDLSIYFRASHERPGSEYYVLEQTSLDASAQYPLGRHIRKVRIESNARHAQAMDLWSTHALGVAIEGPIADLDEDFDGDGVNDVVVYSGIPSSTVGVGPLLVLSGADGHTIGTLDGYEFVLEPARMGGLRVSSVGPDAVRIYEPTSLRALSLVTSRPVTGEEIRPLGSLMGPRHKVILSARGPRVTDFVLPVAPGGVSPELFEGLPKLGQIGVGLTPEVARENGRSVTLFVDHASTSLKGAAQTPSGRAN